MGRDHVSACFFLFLLLLATLSEYEYTSADCHIDVQLKDPVSAAEFVTFRHVMMKPSFMYGIYIGDVGDPCVATDRDLFW